MNENTLNWIKMFGWMTIILFLGFELGMLCSKSLINIEQTNYFYNGSIPSTFKFGVDNETLNYMDKKDTGYIQSCYDWQEPYKSCPNNLKFMNKTGLYCNNTLVCQN